MSTTVDTADSSSGGVVFTHTIYLHFDGVTLAQAPIDSAPDGQTQFSQTAIVFDPYGVSPQPEQILPLVQDDFAAFDVLVTDERPAAGPYTMIVVSPTNPFGAGVLGVSAVDCDNSNPNNIGFAFFGAGSGFTNQEQANTISSQFAHTIGLENITEDVGDLMFNLVGDVDQSFLDMCLNIDDPTGGGGTCRPQHEAECGAGTMQQNSQRELMTILGPSPG